MTVSSAGLTFQVPVINKALASLDSSSGMQDTHAMQTALMLQQDIVTVYTQEMLQGKLHVLRAPPNTPRKRNLRHRPNPPYT